MRSWKRRRLAHQRKEFHNRTDKKAVMNLFNTRLGRKYLNRKAKAYWYGLGYSSIHNLPTITHG